VVMAWSVDRLDRRRGRGRRTSGAHRHTTSRRSTGRLRRNRILCIAKAGRRGPVREGEHASGDIRPILDPSAENT
jgi:hypothetical protein